MEASTALHAKNPDNILQDTIARLTTDNENRVNILSAAKIKQISLDKAYAIYNKSFSNARGFTFVITGNFEFFFKIFSSEVFNNDCAIRAYQEI
ncbi:hypothetical protein D3C87_160880 [compost metagenome]